VVQKADSGVDVISAAAFDAQLGGDGCLFCIARNGCGSHLCAYPEAFTRDFQIGRAVRALTPERVALRPGRWPGLGQIGPCGPPSLIARKYCFEFIDALDHARRIFRPEELNEFVVTQMGLGRDPDE